MQIRYDKSLLGGVPFVVVGGWAVHHYLPGRPAGDGLDLLIPWARFADAEKHLAATRAKRAGDWAPGGSVWALSGGEVLTLVALEDEWVVQALRKPRAGAGDWPVIDLPWLVLMKLGSTRSQDQDDAIHLLGHATAPALRAIRRVVGEYQPQDAEDLDSLAYLGRLDRPAPSRRARTPSRA